MSVFIIDFPCQPFALNLKQPLPMVNRSNFFSLLSINTESDCPVYMHIHLHIHISKVAKHS